MNRTAYNDTHMLNSTSKSGNRQNRSNTLGESTIYPRSADTSVSSSTIQEANNISGYNPSNSSFTYNKDSQLSKSSSRFEMNELLRQQYTKIKELRNENNRLKAAKDSFIHSVTQLEQENQNYMINNEQLIEENKQLNNQTIQLQNEYDILFKTNQQLMDDNKILKKQNDTLNKENRRLLQMSHGTESTMIDQNADYEKTMRNLSNENQKFKTYISQLEDENTKLNKHITSLEKTLNGAEINQVNDLKIDEYRAALNKAKDKIEKYRNITQKLKDKVKTYQLKLKEVESQSINKNTSQMDDDTLSETSTRSNIVSEQEEQINKYKDQINKLIDENKKIVEINNSNQETIMQQGLEITEYMVQIEEISQKYETLVQEFEELKEQQKQDEGQENDPNNSVIVNVDHNPSLSYLIYNMVELYEEERRIIEVYNDEISINDNLKEENIELKEQYLQLDEYQYIDMLNEERDEDNNDYILNDIITIEEIDDREELITKIQILNEQNDQLQKLIDVIKQENENLANRTKDAIEKIEQLDKLNNSFRKRIQTMERDYSSLVQNNQILKNENEKYKFDLDKYEEMENEMRIIKEEYEKIKIDNDNITKERDTYLEQYNSLQITFTEEQKKKEEEETKSVENENNNNNDVYDMMSQIISYINEVYTKNDQEFNKLFEIISKLYTQYYAYEYSQCDYLVFQPNDNLKKENDEEDDSDDEKEIINEDEYYKLYNEHQAVINQYDELKLENEKLIEERKMVDILCETTSSNMNKSIEYIHILLTALHYPSGNIYRNIYSTFLRDIEDKLLYYIDIFDIKMDYKQEEEICDRIESEITVLCDNFIIYPRENRKLDIMRNEVISLNNNNKNNELVISKTRRYVNTPFPKPKSNNNNNSSYLNSTVIPNNTSLSNSIIMDDDIEQFKNRYNEIYNNLESQNTILQAEYSNVKQMNNEISKTILELQTQLYEEKSQNYILNLSLSNLQLEYNNYKTFVAQNKEILDNKNISDVVMKYRDLNIQYQSVEIEKSIYLKQIEEYKNRYSIIEKQCRLFQSRLEDNTKKVRITDEKYTKLLKKYLKLNTENKLMLDNYKSYQKQLTAYNRQNSELLKENKELLDNRVELYKRISQFEADIDYYKDTNAVISKQLHTLSISNNIISRSNYTLQNQYFDLLNNTIDNDSINHEELFRYDVIHFDRVNEEYNLDDNLSYHVTDSNGLFYGGCYLQYEEYNALLLEFKEEEKEEVILSEEIFNDLDLIMEEETLQNINYMVDSICDNSSNNSIVNTDRINVLSDAISEEKEEINVAESSNLNIVFMPFVSIDQEKNKEITLESFDNIEMTYDENESEDILRNETEIFNYEDKIKDEVSIIPQETIHEIERENVELTKLDYESIVLQSDKEELILMDTGDLNVINIDNDKVTEEEDVKTEVVEKRNEDVLEVISSEIVNYHYISEENTVIQSNIIGESMDYSSEYIVYDKLENIQEDEEVKEENVIVNEEMVEYINDEVNEVVSLDIVSSINDIVSDMLMNEIVSSINDVESEYVINDKLESINDVQSEIVKLELIDSINDVENVVVSDSIENINDVESEIVISTIIENINDIPSEIVKLEIVNSINDIENEFVITDSNESINDTPSEIMNLEIIESINDVENIITTNEIVNGINDVKSEYITTDSIESLNDVESEITTLPLIEEVVDQPSITIHYNTNILQYIPDDKLIANEIITSLNDEESSYSISFIKNMLVDTESELVVDNAITLTTDTSSLYITYKESDYIHYDNNILTSNTIDMIKEESEEYVVCGNESLICKSHKCESVIMKEVGLEYKRKLQKTDVQVKIDYPNQSKYTLVRKRDIETMYPNKKYISKIQIPVMTIAAHKPYIPLRHISYPTMLLISNYKNYKNEYILLKPKYETLKLNNATNMDTIKQLQYQIEQQKDAIRQLNEDRLNMVSKTEYNSLLQRIRELELQPMTKTFPETQIMSSSSAYTPQNSHSMSKSMYTQLEPRIYNPTYSSNNSHLVSSDIIQPSSFYDTPNNSRVRSSQPLNKSFNSSFQQSIQSIVKETVEQTLQDMDLDI